MKKLLALVLAMAMMFALAACGAKPAEEPAPAPEAAPAEEVVEEPAPEISGTLVICSSATDQDLAAIEEGFTALYPDVTIEVITCSAGEGVARVEAEAAAPTIDVFYSGLNQADGDKYAHIFEEYVSVHDSEMPAEYQSDNGFYNYDHLSTTVFCVNTDLEAELGLEIDSYEDLLDPALQGKILLSDPTSSSSAWNNLSNIFAVFGYDTPEAWDYITGLLENDLVIVGSSSACFKSVQQGEYVVGLTYEDGASTLLKDGADNIKMVYPAEGASAFAFAAAVVKDAPNMDAAKAMIDYLQSAEGQSFRANYVGTVRFTNEDVVVEESWLPATEDIKWVSRDIPWLIENKSAMLEKWSDLYAQYAE